MSNNTDRIRLLNNIFRQTFIGGQVVLTLGIRSKPEKEVAEILERVRTFNAFNKNNDIYDEQDYLSFDYKGEKIIAKIDYYDKNLQYHSPDPSDSSKTTRIMTILTASEWWDFFTVSPHKKIKALKKAKNPLLYRAFFIL